MKYLPVPLFLALAALIMLPFVGDGYIFLRDMVWPPLIDLADIRENGLFASYPIWMLFSALQIVFPVFVIQKLFLGFILFLCGFGMYRLMRRFVSLHWAFIAGALFMINPYVYEQFLVGHSFILLGYAFFPLVVLSFYTLLTTSGKKEWFLFLISFSLYPILSLQWAYIAAIFLIFYGSIFLFVQKKWSVVCHSKKFYWRLFLSLLFFVGVNSFWIFSESTPDRASIVLESDENGAVSHTVFKKNVLLQTLALYGYVGDDFVLPKDENIYWWVLPLLLLFLSGFGIFQVFQKKNALGITLATISLPLLFFTAGFAELQETMLFIGIIAFMYAFFVPMGVQFLVSLGSSLWSKHVQKWIDASLTFFVLTAAMFFLFPFFQGFGGQVTLSQYPESWKEVNNLLVKYNAKKVLFLPWYEYMSFSFADDRIIRTPARQFFDTPVIAADSPQNISLGGQNNSQWKKRIFSMLSNQPLLPDDEAFLREQEITHIILVKEADWKRYSFLYQNPEIFEIVTNDDGILVYRIRGPRNGG